MMRRVRWDLIEREEREIKGEKQLADQSHSTQGTLQVVGLSSA